MTTSDVNGFGDEASAPAAGDRSEGPHLYGANVELYVHEHTEAPVAVQTGEGPNVACHTARPSSMSPVRRLPELLAIVMIAVVAGCQKPSGDTDASPVPSETGSAPSSADGTAADTDVSSGGFDPTRRLGIRDLDDLPSPGGPAPTTAALPRRSGEATRRTNWPGLVVRTACRGDVCLDGLTDDDTTVIEPTASDAPDEGWMERVVRVPWANGEYVSTYVATSRHARGAAHANNRLRCRTFHRRNGEPVPLDDVLGEASARRLVAKVNGLLDDDRAIAVLGRPLEAAGYTFTSDGFRFGRTADHDGARPEIILCAEGPHPRDSGHMLELRLGAVPVRYLLSPPADQ